MHAPSPLGLLLIAIIVLVLFGRGKVSSLMGEVGKGITAFKRGISDGNKELDDQAVTEARDVSPAPEAAPVTTPVPEKDKV